MRDNSKVEDLGESAGSLTDADREPYLRAALLAFENGSLDAHEYMQRVRAIESAGSVVEMARALGRPTSEGAKTGEGANTGAGAQTGAGAPTGAGAQTGAGADTGTREASRPVYDAVDLARMMAPAPGVRSRGKSSRYTVLIMVVLLFIVLLGIGLWLASRVHSIDSNSGGAVVVPAAALYASPPVDPPSDLSSRR